MPAEKTILKLNASGLKTANCDYRLWLTMIEGYKQETMSSKMLYGIALHKYFDTMFKENGHIGKARDAAVAAFNKPSIRDNKSPQYSEVTHMLATAYDCWETFISKDTQLKTLMLPDGKPATEVTFSIQGYYEDDYVRVDLEGTIDRLAQVVGGIYVINDFKSTSAWQEDVYLKKYAISHQMRFYAFVTKLMADLAPDSMLGQIGKTNIGYCIDGIFIKPKPCDNKYKRSEIFPFNDVAKFKESLDIQIARIVSFIKQWMISNEEPHKLGLVNGSCEGKWGMCSYWGICRAQSNEIAKILLERDFVKKPYDPLHHNDEP